jgi:glycosyltransferase involved in cell wall biosynthesis
MHAWQKRMLEHARLIHVTTDVEADLFAELAPRVPRHIVPVGVDLHEFDDLPDGSSFRRQHLGSYDGPVVLFLGRITYKKGIALLIDAFARVRREMDCRLVIAGPDDERLTPSLKSRALRAGIEEDVIFVGPMFDEDRRAALASADLWVLASQTENFGIAVIEAMAAGCPVVISPAVNLSSLISSANAGLVVDLDPTAVANAIRAVLSEESLRRRLRDSGRAFASRFELRAIVSELEQMYMRAVTPDRLPEVAGAGQPSRA